MENKVNVLDYVKSLPEGSKISFVDDALHPVRFKLMERNLFPEKGKEIYVVFKNQYKPTRIYDIKLLSGINVLALHWDFYKEDFFHFACTQSEDERWKDKSFQQHMYRQYVKTDRPITDQLYNLDDGNLRTLFRYIKEDLLRHDVELVRTI